MLDGLLNGLLIRSLLDNSHEHFTTLAAANPRTLFDQLRRLEVDLCDFEALKGVFENLAARPV